MQDKIRKTDFLQIGGAVLVREHKTRQKSVSQRLKHFHALILNV